MYDVYINVENIKDSQTVGVFVQVLELLYKERLARWLIILPEIFPRNYSAVCIGSYQVTSERRK